MLIQCKSISGGNVPEEQRFPGESSDTSYSPLVEGSNYFVFALLFFSNRIDYLLAPEDELPMWAPSCLFEIKNSEINSDFSVSVINGNGSFEWLHSTYGARFIIGYKKITESFDHFLGILDRNEEDLKIFFEATQKFKKLPKEVTEGVELPKGS